MADRTAHTIVWRLPEYRLEREFTLVVEAETPEQAADRMFVVCNSMDPDSEDGRRWAEMHHRSLSAGDNININGVPWQCTPFDGWKEANETDPRSMEDRLGMPQRDNGVGL